MIYQGTVLGLLIIGLITAVSWLGQHRPRQWRRVAAWDASGWVVIAALFYVRQIILIVIRWPSANAHGWPDLVTGVGMLVLIDTLLLIRVVNFRSFREADRVEHGEDNVIT